MKQIPLKEAYSLLNKASAVSVDDALSKVITAELEGTPDNEFLYLSWKNDGLEFAVRFAEGNNQVVTVNGSSMKLIDIEGDPATITLLAEMQLE